jgi:hypothetical protein
MPPACLQINLDQCAACPPACFRSMPIASPPSVRSTRSEWDREDFRKWSPTPVRTNEHKTLVKCQASQREPLVIPIPPFPMSPPSPPGGAPRFLEVPRCTPRGPPKLSLGYTGSTPRYRGVPWNIPAPSGNPKYPGIFRGTPEYPGVPRSIPRYPAPLWTPGGPAPGPTGGSPGAPRGHPEVPRLLFGSPALSSRPHRMPDGTGRTSDVVPHPCS